MTATMAFLTFLKHPDAALPAQRCCSCRSSLVVVVVLAPLSFIH